MNSRWDKVGIRIDSLYDLLKLLTKLSLTDRDHHHALTLMVAAKHYTLLSELANPELIEP